MAIICFSSIKFLISQIMYTSYLSTIYLYYIGVVIIKQIIINNYKLPRRTNVKVRTYLYIYSVARISAYLQLGSKIVGKWLYNMIYISGMIYNIHPNGASVITYTLPPQLKWLQILRAICTRLKNVYNKSQLIRCHATVYKDASRQVNE